MSFNTIEDELKAKAAREVSPAFSEVALFKQLIRERVHPLDLVRELLSNAEEVGATSDARLQPSSLVTVHSVHVLSHPT